MFSLGVVSPEWISLGVAAAAVAFGFWQSWQNQSQQANRDAVVTDDRIRSLYKDQIQALEDKTSDQTKQLTDQSVIIKDQTKKITDLEAKVVQLQTIIDGRDPSFLAYQQEGRKVFKLVLEELAPAIMATNSNQERMLTIMEAHFTSVQPAKSVWKGGG